MTKKFVRNLEAGRERNVKCEMLKKSNKEHKPPFEVILYEG